MAELRRLAKGEELSENERIICTEKADAIEKDTGELIAAIQKLGGLKSILLLRHYVMNEKVETIAKDMHYAVRHVYRLCEKAIDALLDVVSE